MSIEQLLAIEFDSMRYTDIADGTTRAGGTDRLHHRLLRADALQHRVCTNSPCKLHDAGYPLLSSLRDNVCCTELARTQRWLNKTLFASLRDALIPQTGTVNSENAPASDGTRTRSSAARTCSPCFVLIRRKNVESSMASMTIQLLYFQLLGGEGGIRTPGRL
jgi:hypothetical protein